MGESKEAKEGGSEEYVVTCTRQFSCPSSRVRIYLCYIIMEVVFVVALEYRDVLIMSSLG